MSFDPLSLALGFAAALLPLLAGLWAWQRRLARAEREQALLQERLEHAQLTQAGLTAQLDDCRAELAEVSEIKVEQQSELAGLRRENELLQQERQIAREAAQFGILALTLLVPGQQGFPGALALDTEQLGFAAQGCQFGLLGGIEVVELAIFLATVVQLDGEAILGRLGIGQALFEQGLFGLQGSELALLLPGQAQEGDGGGEQADQQVGDI